MSKFFEDLPDVLEKKKAPTPHRAVRKAPTLGERGCDDCVRKKLWSSITTPRMKPVGNDDAEILILGSAPTEEDDAKGKPFVGEDARILKKLIPGSELENVRYSNSVRCFSFGSPSRELLHSCSIHTDQEITPSTKVIIGVGQQTLGHFYPGAQIWMMYGTKFPIRVGGRTLWYYPVFDPASINTVAHLQNKDAEKLPGYSVLRADLAKVFKEYRKWGKPKIVDVAKHEIIIPRSFEEGAEIIDDMGEYIGLDLEATGLVPYVKNARLLTAAISDDKTTMAWPIAHSQAEKFWHKDGMRLLRRSASRKQWIAHNAAMELKWIRFNFNKHYSNFHDTMALARLYHDREHGQSLANLSRVHLGQDIKSLSNLDVKRLDEYPLNDVLKYNGFDAVGCRLLFDHLYDPVMEKDQDGYERLIGAVQSTVDMELRGLPVDLVAAKAFDKEWEGIVATNTSAIRKLADVKKYETNSGKEFNPNSPVQLVQVLTNSGIKLPKTKSGKSFSADEETLNSLASESKLVKRVLELRGAVKMRSTYIEPILSVPIIYPDGMLHPGYTTTHTATLRLSSEDPNIQNFPKRKHREIRRVVIAGKEYIIVAVDMGQLEVRILAMASKDKTLAEFIISGEDMHAVWLNKCLDASPDYLDKLADRTNETDEKKIRKGGRDTIKTDFVFASFYGSGPDSVAKRTAIPYDIVMDLLGELWKTFPGIKEWHKKQRREFEQYGGVYTLTNRFRHDVLPGNECYNTPIQGTGTDLVVDAQNELYLASVAENDPDLAPRINVHDDLTFLLPDNDAKLEYYLKRIAKAMTKVRYDFQSVPLMVEVKIGENWADMEEVWTSTGDYIR